MEWLALLIPIIAGVFLFIFFKSKVLWWEALIPIVVTIPIILIAKWGSYASQTRDTEYWGGWVVQTEYYEDWNELVTETYTTTDSEGHTQVHTRTRIDYHPAYYMCYNSNAESFSISASTYRDISKRIGGPEKFKDLGRWHAGNDGDMYYTTFSGQDVHVVPTTTVHTYENRIQGSRSIYNYQDVDPEKYGLYEYPDENVFGTQSILGAYDEKANRELNFWNARLGAAKEVRIWLLVFHDKPIEAAIEQEAYWIGGNKNEFVVCVGTSKDKVDWCHVFSWSKSEELKVGVRNWVASMEKLNLEAIVAYTALEVNRKFVRRDFADFDYIDIEMGGLALSLVYILTILSTIGIGIWAVLNSLEDGETFSNRIRYRFKKL